ncbi:MULTISPECIES: hypothetical protein [Inquilinus]|uniref:IPT/TIG domain-containing protein n=1 Tax=Inquilinus ginsengisoli TaxID=363840 RepID=A0ABU1JKA7_9PROT|nr:hypothetical protein [Inquilinus ginsengisoli]MDR6289025.1 hypothetical protein [Inquilinus ginsengisoli]
MSFPAFSFPRLLIAAAIALVCVTAPALAIGPRVVSDDIDPISLIPFAPTSGAATIPVLVQGNPFGTLEFAGTVTQIITAMFVGGRTRYVSVPTPAVGPAAKRGSYLALAFNPTPDLLPGSLCSGRAVSTDVAKRPIVVRAAACLDGQAQSAATGYLDQASGPDDQGFTALIRELTQRLLNL